MPLELHDRVRFAEEAAGVPKGATGYVVLDYGDEVGVDVEDPDLAPTGNGIVYVPRDALEPE